MISNSSPPRKTPLTPLTPLNNSPFSRGYRAVHQGQKRAKASNIGITEANCEIISGLSKDEIDNKNGQLNRSPGDTSPDQQTCDSAYLTPASKGILKRKRKAEMEADEGNGVTFSKKKVIFANPISATKIIESRKNLTPKKIRKCRLRYEDALEELDTTINDKSIEEKDSQQPVVPRATIVIKRLTELELTFPSHVNPNCESNTTQIQS